VRHHEMMNLIAPESEGWVHGSIGGFMNVSYPPGYFDYLHTPEYKAQKAKEEAEYKAACASLRVKARQVIVFYGAITAGLLTWGIAYVLVTL